MSDVKQLSGPEMADRMKCGTRVKRGVDWLRGFEDGRRLGTVTQELTEGGRIRVQWDNGLEKRYCMGRWGKYELQLA